MRTTVGILVVAVLAAGACRSGSGPDEVVTVSGMSVEEIMLKAYDPAYRVPPGFLVDERADTPGSFTIHHVKDASLSYELCSDDYLEAFAWEAADNAARAVNGVFVDAVENDRYFEFVRELEYDESIGNVDEPTSPGFARVFKCSFVNRNGVDRQIRDGFAGRLNARPVDAATVAALTEYLWQFAFFWPASATVLRSTTREQANSIDHTLVIALLTRQGDDRCDRIEVVNWTFAADKSDGELTKQYETIYQFEAEVAGGTPHTC